MQWTAFANRFATEGYTVYIPRLPRHGLRTGGVRNLGDLTTADLIDAADRSVAIARGLGDTVIVVGFSTGATMAAWVAQQRSVHRVVLISPALQITRLPRWLHGLVIALAVNLPDVWHSDASSGDFPDLQPGWSSRGIAHILRLGAMVASDAERAPPSVAAVVLLLNRHDGTVRPALLAAAAQTLQLALQDPTFGAHTRSRAGFLLMSLAAVWLGLAFPRLIIPALRPGVFLAKRRQLVFRLARQEHRHDPCPAHARPRAADAARADTGKRGAPCPLRTRMARRAHPGVNLAAVVLLISSACSIQPLHAQISQAGAVTLDRSPPPERIAAPTPPPAPPRPRSAPRPSRWPTAPGPGDGPGRASSTSES